MKVLLLLEEMSMKYILSVLAIVFFIKEVQSQSYVETDKLVASVRSQNGRFGASVAMSEEYAVIGTHPFTSHTGRVYIFKKQNDNSWAQVQSLVMGGFSFGKAIAIYQDTLVVTADSANSSQGAAYIFNLDSNGEWVFTQEISGADLNGGDNFGVDVDIYENTIVVGSSLGNFDANGENEINDAGTAYIFEKDMNGTWAETKKITASTRGLMDYFGGAVGVTDGFVFVGAENGGSGSDGLVHVFKKENNDWSEVQQIRGADSGLDNFGNFGVSIAVDNDLLVVGSSEMDYDGPGPIMYSDAGAAYIFKRNAQGDWNEMQKVTASDVAEDDLFGYDVAIHGDKLLVGAYFEDEDAANSNTMDKAGSAYLFSLNSANQWVETQKIVASDRESIDYFGWAVSMWGDHLIIGALRESHDENGDNYLLRSGSAYVYQTETSLSTEDQSLSSIDIYPNPTTDAVHLRFDKVQDWIKVRLTSITGQTLTIDTYSGINELTYPIRQKAGMYIMILEDARGAKSYHKVLKK